MTFFKEYDRTQLYAACIVSKMHLDIPICPHLWEYCIVQLAMVTNHSAKLETASILSIESGLIHIKYETLSSYEASIIFPLDCPHCRDLDNNQELVDQPLSDDLDIDFSQQTDDQIMTDQELIDKGFKPVHISIKQLKQLLDVINPYKPETSEENN